MSTCRRHAIAEAKLVGIRTVGYPGLRVQGMRRVLWLRRSIFAAECICPFSLSILILLHGRALRNDAGPWNWHEHGLQWVFYQLVCGKIAEILGISTLPECAYTFSAPKCAPAFAKTPYPAVRLDIWILETGASMSGTLARAMGQQICSAAWFPAVALRPHICAL
jgi:hypothetical protein